MDILRLPGAVATWRRSCLAAVAGDASDRKRYAELKERAGSPQSLGALVTACHLAAVPTYGWWLLVLVALAHLVLVGGPRASDRGVPPEVVHLASFVLLTVNLGVAVAGTGGAHSPLMALLLVPVAIQAASFRAVIAMSLTGFTAATALAASLIALILPPAALAPDWLQLLVFATSLHSVLYIAIHLAGSDRAARTSATTDPLTGLPNRRALDQNVSDLQRQADSTASVHGAVRAPLSSVVGVVVIDVDHFKSINDTYGHDRGDAVLQALAERLLSAVRAPKLLHRVGGEEFSLLLPGADTAACAVVAERLCAAVRAAPLAGLPVTISAGVATSGHVAGDVSAALARADGALYQAKREGRDRVAVS